jgi:hypothetical protein
MRSKQDGSLNDSQSVMPENSMDEMTMFDKSQANINKISEYKERNQAIQALNKFRRKLKSPMPKGMTENEHIGELLDMLPVALSEDF